MPDARITFEGKLGSEPRYNTPNGEQVANLRVLAGRSRKNEAGEWENVNTVAYDCAFWGPHAQLVDALRPSTGDSVVVSGSVTGVESYQGKNGESLSVKVSGDGLRVFPKRGQGDPVGRGGQATAGQNQNWGQQPQQGWGQQDAWGGGNDSAPF